MPLSKFLCAAFAGTCLFSGTASHAADCVEIHFKAGEKSASVTGAAPADGATCWRFRPDAGRTVRLSVQSDHAQVAFSIVGLVDNRIEYTFTSQKQPYDILIHQTMKATSPVNYRLTISTD